MMDNSTITLIIASFALGVTTDFIFKKLTSKKQTEDDLDDRICEIEKKQTQTTHALEDLTLVVDDIADRV